MVQGENPGGEDPGFSFGAGPALVDHEGDSLLDGEARFEGGFFEVAGSGERCSDLEKFFVAVSLKLELAYQLLAKLESYSLSVQTRDAHLADNFA